MPKPFYSLLQILSHPFEGSLNIILSSVSSTFHWLPTLRIKSKFLARAQEYLTSAYLFGFMNLTSYLLLSPSLNSRHSDLLFLPQALVL